MKRIIPSTDCFPEKKQKDSGNSNSAASLFDEIKKQGK
jgi:hypothetical protein